MTAPTSQGSAWDAVPGVGALRWLGDSWSAFWFTPRPASTLAAFRVAVGVTAFCWGLSLSFDLTSFYGDSGIKPNPFYPDHDWTAWEGHRLGLMQWFGSDTSIRVIWGLLLVSAALVVAGRWLKLSAPLMWLCVLSFHQDNSSIGNAGDDLLRIWCLYLALFCLLTPNRLTSVPLFGRRDVDGTRWYPMAPSWLLRLVQVQMTIIYPASVIAKLAGDRWLDGTASLYALGLTDFERFWVPGILRDSVALGAVFTWATLAVEFALPFLLWTKRTRRAAIVMGVGLHLSFQYSMRLGFFGWVMTSGYIAFLTASESERILRFLRRLVPFGSNGEVDDRLIGVGVGGETLAGSDVAGGRVGGTSAGEQESGEQQRNADDERQGEGIHLVDGAVEQPPAAEGQGAEGDRDVGDHQPPAAP